MSTPHVEITPLRPAVKSDSPTVVDVLIAVTPPEDTKSQRPPMNILSGWVERNLVTSRFNGVMSFLRFDSFGARGS